MVWGEESRGGCEHFFDELASGAISPSDEMARYGCEPDLASIAVLCERFGLTFPAR
jgi:hypothetical protein